MGDKKKKSNNGIAIFFDMLLSLALLGGIGYGGYYLVSQGKNIEQKTNYTENIVEVTTEEETTEPGMPYDSIEISNQEIYNGSLVAVNYEFPFQGSEEELVSLYQIMLEKDCHSFGVRDAEVKVQREYADHLIDLFNAFYNETFDNDVIVQSGYRSPERQKELYDADLQKTGLDYSDTVAQPGYSEHQTGWGVDLSLSQAEYDGTGNYSWINEHCTDFGIMLRYPENKVDVTRISFEPWHYRYAGIPHAGYITQNDLCLEEYINLLYGYAYENEHLQITDNQNQLYEIYYYPADSEQESTMLPVPADHEYTISGNNKDGFIVTVHMGEATIQEEAPEDAENAEPEDNPAPENAEDAGTEDTPAPEEAQETAQEADA